MNKDRVRSIIETMLTSGSKNPGLFDLPKILWIKNRLESCSSIDEVVAILETNRSLISKSFGLSEATFNDGLVKLKSM